MTFTLSRNLRLRVDSGLTANAKYNLSRIDLIGSTLTIDTNQATTLRSIANINIEPQSTAVGGTGIGGTLNLGTSTHSLAAINLYATLIRLNSPLSLKDTNSVYYTSLRNTSTGASADSFLTLDTNNANRSVSLRGDLTLAGNLSTSGSSSITFTSTATTTLTLPTSGTLVTLTGTETLTNKNITGTFTGPLTGNASGTAANITGVAAIANGGTGQSTAQAARNAILPDQSGNSGKILLTDGTNAAWVAAGGGSVTSIGISAPADFTVSGAPVTTSGTIALSYITQTANRIFAGPGAGGPLAPTFRSLVVADIPAGVSHSGLTNLGTDDHTQYHTDARALTWIGTRSTSDLPEGTNKYLTSTNLSTNHTTTNLPEGSNLYYTDVRADARITAQKAAVNGLATLDGGGKIPVAQLPSAIMSYQGNWNATTNSPTLIDVTGDAGDVYRVSVAGTQDLGSGSNVYNIGDWVVYNGTIWERSDNADAVTSVNGLSGAVSLTTTNISEGTNLYYTDSRVNTLLATKRVFATWTPGDGLTRTVVHSFSSADISWNIYDIDTGEEIWPDTATRGGSPYDDITFVASQAPVGTGWKVCVRRN